MATIPERIKLQRHKYWRYYSPSGKILKDAPCGGRGECAVERDEFDRELARQALAAGAAIVLHTNVESLLKEDGKIIGVVTNSPAMPKVLAKVVIGAGGQRSRRMGITKQEGMTWTDEAWRAGVYYEVAGVKDANPEVSETQFLPGVIRNQFHLWHHEGDRYATETRKLEEFNQLKQMDYPVLRRFRNAYPLRMAGWQVGTRTGQPLPKGMVNDGLLLAGDAGGYHGMIHAAISGRWAGEVAADAIREGNVSKARLSAYGKKCKAKLPHVYLMACFFKGGLATLEKLAALSSVKEIERFVTELAERDELKSWQQLDF